MRDRNIFLVQPSILKDLCFVDKNIDDKPIILSIRTSQDLLLEPLLGTQLYLEILQQALNSNLLPAYKFLVENFIVYIIGYSVKKDLFIDMTFKLKNKGVVTSSDDRVSTTSLNDIKYLQTELENKVAWYSNRLIEYLCAHKNEYPEYNVIIDKSDYSSGNINYNSPVYLKKYRK